MIADPVPIDAPQPYGLARFGAPAGIVLTPARPRSRELPYRLGRGDGARRGWLKVRLRATVVTAGDHGTRGLGAVVLYTDGRASASAEFQPVRRRGRRALRWTEIALHHDEEHVTTRRRFEVSLDNYARTQGSTPGVHRLSFGLRLDAGIQVRRVVIRPESGLLLSRQPPQALSISSVVVPPRPRPGEPFALRYTVRNRGVLPSGAVTLPAILPPGVDPAGPSPELASIPAGARRTAELRLRAEAPGSYSIQTLARSAVGEALDVRDVEVGAADTVAAAARDPAVAAPGAADEGGGRVAGAVAAVGSIGLGAVAIAAFAVRRRRVRT